MKNKILALLLIILSSSGVLAQKVGLVFSGGGAKGLSHIGVLKALEENNIPIDYITGTSMGGIVGGMYAAGYSPLQIEEIALSKDFQNWISGRYSSKYHYFFKKKPDNPSLLTAKLQIDTGFHTTIRSNLINDIPLNFALLELVAQPSANAGGDFNKLFVPFRCIVSDVFSQTSIPVSKGSLMEAMRGTMTVPLVYRPIKVDGKYVFDGGLYNNFPVDVMKKDFSPDYIIGVNVSSKVFNDYPKDNDEKLMNRFLVYMFLSKSDSTAIGKNGKYIQPDLSEYSVTNFRNAKELIQKGYDATMAEMPAIKAAVKQRITHQQLQDKRIEFMQKNPPLTFNNILVTGINSKQQRYVQSVFRSDTTFITLQDIKKGYYKLVSDDNFETVYPKMNYNAEKNSYEFELQVQPQNNFIVDFGGNISTRPISNIYLGLQYNYLRSQSYTFSANFYSGRFYESAQTAVRMDIPTRIPLFLETEFTYNHWNYYSTSQIFVENASPTYVEESDRNILVRLGIPFSSNGKMVAHSGFISFNEQYSPTNNFQTGDELDYTGFSGFNAGLSIEVNSLNRKQYATKGFSLLISIDHYNGNENYIPGNILRNEPIYPTLKPMKVSRAWFRAKLSTNQYILSRKTYSLGYLLEGVISNKPEFNTFKSTVLSAPAFYPLPDSRSLYLEKFHATTYGAFGLKNIFRFRKAFDFRLEGYIFQPLEEFKKNNYQSTSFGEIFSARQYAATAGLVYHSPIGPLSLHLNYYDDQQKRFGVIFNAGFLIYNKRSYE